MRRFGSLLLVLVLATASLLAAAAYNTATVVNAGTLHIASTNNAILRLNPSGGVGNKDATVRTLNGELDFRFGIGKDTTGDSVDDMHGLQPNSEYVWQNLFYITNVSKETVQVTITVSGGLEAYVYFGTIGGAFTNYPGSPANTWSLGTVTYTNPLGTGCTGNVCLKIVVPHGTSFPADIGTTLTVTAVAL